MSHLVATTEAPRFRRKLARTLKVRLEENQLQQINQAAARRRLDPSEWVRQSLWAELDREAGHVSAERASA